MFSYLDTSALVKLVTAEPESAALLDWIRRQEGRLATGLLSRTELLRAVQRAAPDRLDRASTVLDSLHIIGMPPLLFAEAARLDPPTLRTLDALHLASALRLGTELGHFVSYDERLNEAARHLNIRVASPR